MHLPRPPGTRPGGGPQRVTRLAEYAALPQPCSRMPALPVAARPLLRPQRGWGRYGAGEAAPAYARCSCTTGGHRWLAAALAAACPVAGVAASLYCAAAGEQLSRLQCLCMRFPS